MFVYGVVAGMCQPRALGTVGAEPFSAKLRYTGAEDPDHPNLIKLTVTMPHIDGKNSRFLWEERFSCFRPMPIINNDKVISVGRFFGLNPLTSWENHGS